MWTTRQKRRAYTFPREMAKPFFASSRIVFTGRRKKPSAAHLSGETFCTALNIHANLARDRGAHRSGSLLRESTRKRVKMSDMTRRPAGILKAKRHGGNNEEVFQKNPAPEIKARNVRGSSRRPPVGTSGKSRMDRTHSERDSRNRDYTRSPEAELNAAVR